MPVSQSDSLSSEKRLDGTTHSEGCWNFGPKHYKCALLRVKQLTALLDESEVFVVAWAAHYSHLNLLPGWHPRHLEALNKIRAVTGGVLMTAEDVAHG